MKNLIEKIKSLDKGTIIRTVLLVCTIANQIVAALGSTSFASHPAYQVCSIIVTVVMSVITAWKNNDFTYFAQLGTAVMHALKDGKITIEEVTTFLKEKEEEKPEEEEVLPNNNND